MEIFSKVTLLWLLFGSVTSYDAYTDDGWFFRNYGNLTEIPTDIPDGAVGVYINNNQITMVTRGVLSNLASCTFFSLSNNNISKVEAGAFQGLSSIDDLTLFQNKLTSLEAGMFSGLEALDNLVLSNNQIATIATDAFLGLSNLKKLYLFGNKLTQLTVKMFSGLDSLDELTLSFNQIVAMERGCFDGLGRVEELWVDNNFIRQIVFEQFLGLTSMKLLHMTFNNVTTVEDGAFKDQSRLQKMWLDSSDISSLNKRMFEGLGSIELINLDGNLLTEVPGGVFNELTTLIELDFENNSVSLVHEDAFTGLDKLTTVWFNWNQLTTINASLFYPLPRPLTLAVNDNPLECGEDLCWLKKAEQEGWVRWIKDHGNGEPLKPDCLGGKKWDNITCPEEVSCPDPGGVAHAARSPARWPFVPGTTIHYKCNYCYTGGGTVTCQKSGNWTRKPECEIITCKDPGRVLDGYKIPAAGPHTCGHHITYLCRSGYTIRGRSTINCKEDGKFDAKPPTCLKIEEPDTAASTATSDGSSKIGLQWILVAAGSGLVVIVIIILVLVTLKRRGYRLCYRQPRQEDCREIIPPTGSSGLAVISGAEASTGAEGGGFVNKAAMLDDDDVMRYEKLRHSAENDADCGYVNMTSPASSVTSPGYAPPLTPTEPPPEYTRHPSSDENHAQQ